jgi:hypothetical protein
MINMVATGATEPFGGTQFSRPLGGLKGHQNFLYSKDAARQSCFCLL